MISPEGFAIRPAHPGELPDLSGAEPRAPESAMMYTELKLDTSCDRLAVGVRLPASVPIAAIIEVGRDLLGRPRPTRSTTLLYRSPLVIKTVVVLTARYHADLGLVAAPRSLLLQLGHGMSMSPIADGDAGTRRLRVAERSCRRSDEDDRRPSPCPPGGRHAVDRGRLEFELLAHHPVDVVRRTSLVRQDLVAIRTRPTVVSSTIAPLSRAP